MIACPSCGYARETIEGADFPVCLNPLCAAADIIHEDSVARIVIEHRQGAVYTSWWRADTVDAFEALRLSGVMLLSAAETLGGGLLRAMRGMARRN